MAVDQHNPHLLLLPPPFLSPSDFHKSTVSLHHNGTTAITTMPHPIPLREEEEEQQQVSYGSASSVETGDGSELDEEDDYISELTRQMARYKLQEKIWGLSGSPQSTIFCKQNGPSSPSVKNTNQALTDYQIRAIQFYKLKQEQIARKQLRNKQLDPTKLQHLHNKENPKPTSSPNTGPAHQHYLQLQPPGSGMRAVFLGGSGYTNRPCGTGVFLPRGARSNPSESRKKPGCSTVLIPARVAHALKLHFEQVGVVSRANTNNLVGNASDSPMQHDVGKSQDHKWQFETVPAANNHQYEMGLPQEWTY